MKNKHPITSLRIGIVANEFFDPQIGRVGGFGWAAKKAADVFKHHPKCKAEVCFITADEMRNGSSGSAAKYETPLLSVQGNRFFNLIKLLPRKIDILLTIDYRSNYRTVFNALPFTPVITWVRDPRPPQDIEKINSLKIPDKKHITPAGIGTNNTRELARYRERSFPLSGNITLANKMPYMRKSNETVYGLPESEFILPNPSVVDYSAVKVKKSGKPTVIFMGRLDPIKRPWLFIELASKFPEVDFLVLGKNHFQGEGSWNAENVPVNVKLLGHVTGEEKYQILSSAWVFVNTSIHEESPVSVMEALAFETPVISYEDWGQLVSRHGIAIGQHQGTGIGGLPDLADALKLLLSDDDLRSKYGKAGREYVEREHNNEKFLSAFREICINSGVTKAAKSISI